MVAVRSPRVGVVGIPRSSSARVFARQRQAGPPGACSAGGVSPSSGSAPPPLRRRGPLPGRRRR
eukprot:1760877-Lingulodinium_polyedra.AAC.1